MFDNRVPIMRPQLEKFDLNGIEVTIDLNPLKDAEEKDEFRKRVVELIKEDPEAFDGDRPLVKRAYAELSVNILDFMFGPFSKSDLMICISYDDEWEW